MRTGIEHIIIVNRLVKRIYTDQCPVIILQRLAMDETENAEMGGKGTDGGRSVIVKESLG